MSKVNQVESIVHDWVSSLTFQQQALLMTGIRGPDGIRKYDLSKFIVRYLRGAVLKPAGDWDGSNNNDFMWGQYNREDYKPSLFYHYAKAFWDDHDYLPHHFIMHLFHCAEVLAYKYPDPYIKYQWLIFYAMGCEAFHLKKETEEEMDLRLNDFKPKEA